MVDRVNSGTLLRLDANEVEDNSSSTFRDRRGASRSAVYVYCSIAVAIGDIQLMIKDPSGTFREFQVNTSALTGAANNCMAHFVLDHPFGEGRVDVNLSDPATNTDAKSLYAWFVS
ncbi:hypothetical protein CMI37_23160 [Candidatus Pacearchaeota archaeon]|nr:hypothetical protein [Candidatus Pacearchaeota archaeon]|tara:strand:- start:928 stop:1275 length:348 start_codon:yes stop_codon:yes gene_type:complete